jgi:hypothetical protein
VHVQLFVPSPLFFFVFVELFDLLGELRLQRQVPVCFVHFDDADEVDRRFMDDYLRWVEANEVYFKFDGSLDVEDVNVVAFNYILDFIELFGS